LVFKITYFDLYCGKCGIKYEKNTHYNAHGNKLCRPCQITYLKDNFVNWTSGNEKIDNLIQEKQLNYDINDKVFEWIPYDKLIDIKETGSNCLTTAIWKDGPLYCEVGKKELARESYEKVCLKYLHNSQYITDEFLNEVSKFSISKV
jgi:hypothetical protein